MVQLRSAPRLEITVVGLGLAGGVALIIAGVEYGLSSRSGVGPGTFPATAGVLLTLAAVLWGVEVLRRPAHALHAAPLLESALGNELTHRIADVEHRVDGHIELDESITATATALDEDEEPASKGDDRAGAWRVAIVLGSVALAAALLPVLGFVLVMTLQLTVIVMVAGKQPWPKALVLALITSIITSLIFGQVLDVPLPDSGLPLLSDWGI